MDDSRRGGLVGGTVDAPRGSGFFHSRLKKKLATKMPMSIVSSNTEVSMMQKQYRECVAIDNIERR